MKHKVIFRNSATVNGKNNFLHFARRILSLFSSTKKKNLILPHAHSFFCARLSQEIQSESPLDRNYTYLPISRKSANINSLKIIPQIRRTTISRSFCNESSRFQLLAEELSITRSRFQVPFYPFNPIVDAQCCSKRLKAICLSDANPDK